MKKTTHEPSSETVGFREILRERRRDALLQLAGTATVRNALKTARVSSLTKQPATPAKRSSSATIAGQKRKASGDEFDSLGTARCRPSRPREQILSPTQPVRRPVRIRGKLLTPSPEVSASAQLQIEHEEQDTEISSSELSASMTQEFALGAYKLLQEEREEGLASKNDILAIIVTSEDGRSQISPTITPPSLDEAAAFRFQPPVAPQQAPLTIHGPSTLGVPRDTFDNINQMPKDIPQRTATHNPFVVSSREVQLSLPQIYRADVPRQVIGHRPHQQVASFPTQLPPISTFDFLPRQIISPEAQPRPVTPQSALPCTLPIQSYRSLPSHSVRLPSFKDVLAAINDPRNSPLTISRVIPRLESHPGQTDLGEPVAPDISIVANAQAQTLGSEAQTGQARSATGLFPRDFAGRLDARVQALAIEEAGRFGRPSTHTAAPTSTRISHD
ncbi:hypothetical protein GGS24DRAFT_456209 [Hypoxylon argillaceum]|nr:hypothetical protein GGS24DRAFT_456209 [Hypoxylon argillaceum]KAI1156205.1 hypothetical protein F4825DRAFT_317162 [Nemania diffusa]